MQVSNGIKTVTISITSDELYVHECKHLVYMCGCIYVHLYICVYMYIYIYIQWCTVSKCIYRQYTTEEGHRSVESHGRFIIVLLD